MSGSPPFADPRALMRRHGVAAKKGWSQNFLVADGVYCAIVGAVGAAADDWVVELGAGLGTLTARLAEVVPAGRVVAVEREREMLAVLHAELGERGNVEIVDADAMRFDVGAVAARAGRRVRVCGNLPYQIASQILLALVAQRRALSRAVLLIQREMADRLLAPPGTRAYGVLGILVQAYVDVSMVARVSAGSFVPRPRVESTVIALAPLPEDRPRAPIDDPEHFAAVVHAAFGQRRKTLRNALRARYGPGDVEAALAAVGIDGQRRGETLDVGELAALARALPAGGR